MANKELEQMLERVHKDIDIFDFDGKNVPRIILSDRQFDNMMLKIQGKPISVDTNLNILQDGLGHVFVEITLDFSHGDIHNKFLIMPMTRLIFLRHWQILQCLHYLLQITLKSTKTKSSWFNYPNQKEL